MSQSDIVDGAATSDAREFSRAFENMVTDGDDLIGLLAYARYKQLVRDEVAQGVRVPGRVKNPSEDIVRFYRQAAQQQLEQFAASAIDEAQEEIQDSAILNRLNQTDAGLREHITQSTGSLRAIFTNLVAWLITAFMTALLILSDAGDRLISIIGIDSQSSDASASESTGNINDGVVAPIAEQPSSPAGE